MLPPRLFYGYKVVAAGFVIQWVCAGIFSSFGVFFKPLLNEFGWSRAALSGAASMAVMVMGATAMVVGHLTDRVGPRVLMAISAVLLGVGYLGMWKLGAQWQLYVFYGAAVGAGMSTHDVLTLSTAARWFVRRRGMMTGLIKAGTGGGMLTVPLIATAFMAAYGWRSTFLLVAIVIMAVIVPVALVLRRDPAQMGLVPYGGRQRSESAALEPEAGVTLRQVVRIRQFWLLSMAYLAADFCLLTIMVHIVPHATDMGISEPKAAGVLATLGGISIAGRFVVGTGTDKIGGRRALVGCFVFLVAGLLWLQFAREAWMLYLFAVLNGFAHGGFFTVISPTIAELFGLRAHGAIFGIIVFTGTIGSALGPLFAGYMFDLTQTYDIVFRVLAASAVVGLTLSLFVRPVEVHQVAH